MFSFESLVIIAVFSIDSLVDAEQKELAKNKRAFDYNQYNTLADVRCSLFCVILYLHFSSELPDFQQWTVFT